MGTVGTVALGVGAVAADGILMGLGVPFPLCTTAMLTRGSKLQSPDQNSKWRQA